MSARDRILGRLRAAQPATSTLLPLQFDPACVAAIVPSSAAALTDRLRASLEAFHAEVHSVAPGEWETTLAEVCRAKGVKTLAVPRGHAVSKAFTAARLRVFDTPLDHWKGELFDNVDAGFCRADCAIAEPGMLVVRAAPDQPRTLSLVPPIHICLVDTNKLYATMLSAMQGEQWASLMPSNLIFISGPSKTADIQQTLAYGAHGPKELVVLLCHAENAQ